MAHETFIGSIIRHGLNSKYLKNILPFGASWLNSITGAHLTGAQQEANAFTAQQAQAQMDFQQQMRDTQYQSAVTDMQNAGINPALMYGSGASGNVAPSGAMASSVQPSQPDPVGLIGQIANLSLLDAERKLKDSQAQKNLQDIEESKDRQVKLRNESASILKNMDLLDRTIAGLELDNEAKTIANQFIQREHEMGLEISRMTAKELETRSKEHEANFDKLSAEAKTEIQKLANMEQELQLLLLNQQEARANIGQINELTKNIRETRNGIITDNKIKEKDLDWYTWNQIGSSVGSAVKGVGKLVTKLPFKKAPKIGFGRR